MDHRRLVERLCARAPTAVDVCCGAETSRGPIEVVSPEQRDGSGDTVRGRGGLLRLPAHHCPSALPGVELDTTDRAGVTTTHRVHERYPDEGDGMVDVLVIVLKKAS